ncbi:hypothetical protein BC351_25010 [Paenibacillus ferrarius]|uniref:Uncharacterized protein n=1 Tax=Paenibacillus ferrarius TaxID=1469647 RepID=A0A1V4HJ29_9BACL|nr:hypothetical protein [Paenibacillus ferrarius]OPH57133.1 hypothetical protein BC351_25010 [Paenibacillus ferrarius]
MPTHHVQIWAVNDGEKIHREDLTNPNRHSNSVWNDQVVQIFGARNEVVALQLIVQTSEYAIRDVTVEVSALTHTTNKGITIHNQRTHPEDPNDYVGRRIEVFTEHYLYVSPELTTPPQWFYVASAPPLQQSGWIPDALIPHDAHRGPGEQPVHVQALTNQGFWIDIYIPDESAIQSGIYSGAITVS